MAGSLFNAVNNNCTTPSRYQTLQYNSALYGCSFSITHTHLHENENLEVKEIGNKLSTVLIPEHLVETRIKYLHVHIAYGFASNYSVNALCF